MTGAAKENKLKVKQNQFLPLVMLQLAALHDTQLLMSSPQLSTLWTNNFYKIMYVFIPCATSTAAREFHLMAL